MKYVKQTQLVLFSSVVFLRKVFMNLDLSIIAFNKKVITPHVSFF